MTDFRALCTELVELLEVSEEWSGCTQPQALTRAHAALAEDPVEPTDEAPENVDELVSEKLPDLRQNLETVIRCSRAYDGYSTMTPIELADRIIDAVVSWHPSTLPHQRAVLARWGQP
jgi:hypothetical protein